MRVVYMWDNGAFVSDIDPFFPEHYKDLVEMFGGPTNVDIRDDEDWDNEPKTKVEENHD
jgi:hypothetical protein